MYALFYVTLLFNVNRSLAEPEPEPGNRYHAPWSMINSNYPQSYFNPIVSSSSGSSRFHRPSYFVGYNPMPEIELRTGSVYFCKYSCCVFVKIKLNTNE